MLSASAPEARSEPQAAQSCALFRSDSPALVHVSKLKRAEVQELCHLYCLTIIKAFGYVSGLGCNCSPTFSNLLSPSLLKAQL